MNTVTYTIPRPVPEESSLAMLLATDVMQWVPTDTIGGITLDDNRPRAYLHISMGCLKGTPALVSHVEGREVYSRTYQAWDPIHDGHAAREFRSRLQSDGWLLQFEERIALPRWVCTMTMPQSSARNAVGTGNSLEESVCRAASAALFQARDDSRFRKERALNGPDASG